MFLSSICASKGPLHDLTWIGGVGALAGDTWERLEGAQKIPLSSICASKGPLHDVTWSWWGRCISWRETWGWQSQGVITKRNFASFFFFFASWLRTPRHTRGRDLSMVIRQLVAEPRLYTSLLTTDMCPFQCSGHLHISPTESRATAKSSWWQGLGKGWLQVAEGGFVWLCISTAFGTPVSCPCPFRPQQFVSYLLWSWLSSAMFLSWVGPWV